MNHIFEQLAATASRNDKIQLLKNNDSPLLRQIIHKALDPFTQFYIRKIPSYAPDPFLPTMTLNSAINSLSALSDRRVTGNAAIEFLRDLLTQLDSEDAKVIERIIQKDLKCGAAEGTVNKAFGEGFVEEYPVMLCSPMDQKTLAKMNWPAMVQLKLDGMRFNAIYDGTTGKVSLRSRNGKLIDLHGKLEDDFADMVYNCCRHKDTEIIDSIVFDGELLVYRDGKPMSRQEGNGILNKAVKGTITKEEAELVHATIWDVMTLDGVRIGRYEHTYQDRLGFVKQIVPYSTKIHVVESEVVNNIEDAQAIFEGYLAQGQEGIILKDLFEPWENKRVKHQIKFKAELTADLRCVGWTEGTGKYAGMLGALNLKSGDDVITVDVGTGFTDEMRRTLTPENTIGKIIEIKYNARIADKRTGKESLFLPVFLNIREDKNHADSSLTIK